MSSRETMAEDRIILLEALLDFDLLPILNCQKAVHYELSEELQKLAKSQEKNLPASCIWYADLCGHTPRLGRTSRPWASEDPSAGKRVTTASLQDRDPNSPTVKFKN